VRAEFVEYIDTLFRIEERIGLVLHRRVTDEMMPSYNASMPMRLNLVTEKKGYHIEFSRNLGMSLDGGAHSSPDATVEGPHSLMEKTLRMGSRSMLENAVRTRKIKLSAHTLKGELAILYFRYSFEGQLEL
jgi:hypothetical protein